jgi:hypothetical protein
MAAKTEWCGEVIGRAEVAIPQIASTETASTRERDAALYITVNLLNIMPAREVQGGFKGTETVSKHYWMNSLPFVKQSS